MVAAIVQNKTSLNYSHFLSTHQKSQEYLFRDITYLPLSHAAPSGRRQASLHSLGKAAGKVCCRVEIKTVVAIKLGKIH